MGAQNYLCVKLLFLVQFVPGTDLNGTPTKYSNSVWPLSVTPCIVTNAHHFLYAVTAATSYQQGSDRAIRTQLQIELG